MIYTGIGSRETTPDMLNNMEEIGALLAMLGYTLRSGGADGADSAFERGAIRQGGKMEIILPWNGFNNKQAAQQGYCLIPPSKVEEAARFAALYHPAWDRLSQGVKRLHTRNVPQILGLDLNTPTDFVICWTQGGQMVGGTAQALRIAQSHNITIYNLANHEDWVILLNYLRVPAN